MNLFNNIPQAIEDLKQGKIIIVIDDENRENEGDFVFMGELITPEVINFMITHGKGLICSPISEQIAKKFDLIPMVNNNTDPLNTSFTVTIDYLDTGTGISAESRARTIKMLTDKDTNQYDFRRPGHVFPLIAKEGGVLVRDGHTEAAVDLAKLCGFQPVGVICEILNSDGTMARLSDLIIIAQQFNLKIITIKDLIEYRKKFDKLVKLEVKVKLPNEFGDFDILGYSTIIDKLEYLAIVKGEFPLSNSQQIPLVRVHSECMTGDVFRSKRCDCGEHLSKSLEKINQENLGVVIYLRQEGRGIGLFNKLKCYKLQELGYDTVEANLKLGFKTDLREYFIAAQILKDLGIYKVRLITNNPNKISDLNKNGIEVVERIAVDTTVFKENKNYLLTKRKKLGHIITNERCNNDLSRNV